MALMCVFFARDPGIRFDEHMHGTLNELKRLSDYQRSCLNCTIGYNWHNCLGDITSIIEHQHHYSKVIKPVPLIGTILGSHSLVCATTGLRHSTKEHQDPPSADSESFRISMKCQRFVNEYHVHIFLHFKFYTFIYTQIRSRKGWSRVDLPTYEETSLPLFSPAAVNKK